MILIPLPAKTSPSLKRRLMEIRALRSRAALTESVTSAYPNPDPEQSGIWPIARLVNACRNMRSSARHQALPCPDSTACATRSIVASSKCLPITCTPIGSPAFVSPHGTLTPQMPARLAATE